MSDNIPENLKQCAFDFDDSTSTFQPNIITIKPSDFSWLAGLIEGEGCFTHHVTRRAREYHDIHIIVRMVDKDIVSRCFDITRLGHISGPYQQGETKPKLVWKVTRRCDAVALMIALPPFMGVRRQSKIDELLSIHKQYPPETSQWYRPCRILFPQESDEFAWLAGLIEGEGNFGYYFDRRQQSHNLSIEVTMTDEDIVRRCHLVSGVGVFRGPYNHDNRGRKTTWTWKVNARNDIISLMMKLRPFMGERRCARIDELLTIHESNPLRLPWQRNLDKTHCPQGHPYEGENLYILHGTRNCRECAKQRKIRYNNRISQDTSMD